jgi:hypothetical protein
MADSTYFKRIADTLDAAAASQLTTPWDGTAIDAGTFDEIQIGVSGLSGGDSIAVKGSVTGTNPVTLTGVKMADNTTLTSITANGLYSFPACGKVEYAKTGSASTPTVNLLRK